MDQRSCLWLMLLAAVLAATTLREAAADERLNLPPRAAGAATGSRFFGQIESLSPIDREAAILKEIMSGNIPEFLRSLKPIRLEAQDSQGTEHKAAGLVTCDYLSVGTNDDFFRVPMRPK